jgi:arsenite-transporting ATPase
VIPDNAKEGFMDEWYESQQKYLSAIENDFSPMPIFRVPLFKSEVTGIERLRQLGERLYGDKNPADLFYEEKPVSIRQDEDGSTLRVKLPFAATDKIELSRLGAVLTLSVGTRTRDIVLPDSLAGLNPREAAMVEGYLEIKFDKPFAQVEA